MNPLRWAWLWLISEKRICPDCAEGVDLVDAILGPRKRYIGRCPKCGKFWT